MTNPSPNGMKVAMPTSIAVVRRSPLHRKDRITRPEKMSRIPFTHIKGKAAGSWIGMPKAVEAPTGLRMKLMPIPMIPTGITRVHQKSSEFLLKVELSKLVVRVHLFFLSRHTGSSRCSERSRLAMLGQVGIDAIHVTPDVVRAPAPVIMSGGPNARARVHLGAAERVEL